MPIIKNNLGYNSGLFVYQDKESFNYSIDTIMLGNFVSIKKRSKNVLEIGSNNAALSIFVAARKNDLHIDAIEIQKEACEIAQKNVELNNLKDRITIINKDFNDFYKEMSKKNIQKYDTIICNPPFYKLNNATKKNKQEKFIIATHEIKIELEQIFLGASKIIKQTGYLAMVHKTERLIDIVCLMRKYKFEPKKIQFIHPRVNQKSNLVLIEGRYQVGWGTFFLENLYLHSINNKKHEYTKKIKAIYKPILYK